MKNDGRVQTQSVKGNIEGEPRPSGSKENLEVLPLPEMSTEVGPRMLWHGGSCFQSLLGLEHEVTTVIVETLALVVRNHSVGVSDTPVNIGFDIDGVSGCFGDGQSEVESDESRDTADTDDGSPSLIDTLQSIDRFTDDLGLEGRDRDDCDDTRRD